MKYKLVIFDLDGTLLDTIGDLAAAVEHALSLKGYEGHTIDEYRTFVGHGIRNLVWQAMPDGLRDDDSLLESCLADFMDYYFSHIDVLTRPYAGMTELVGALDAAGVRMAVASNKFQAGTERLIARFFPGIKFVCVFGNRPSAPLKPDPALIDEIIDLAGVERSEAVMVGDSATDIKAAENGGIDSIAVSWGFRPRESLTAAGTITDSPSALAEALGISR